MNFTTVDSAPPPSSVAGLAFGLLRLPRTVLFGVGQRLAVGSVAASFGRNTLICTDSRLGNSPELLELTAVLAEAGVSAQIFDRTEPELPTDGVVACVADLKLRSVDSVIGFGGGSCIDMAKVVALLLSHGGAPADYYGENAVPGPILPVIALPTTAGTGSEATPVAVLSDPTRAMKVGISSPHLVPQAAICDPELTYSCPASLTAASGIDAVVHLVESFTSIRRPPNPALSSERVFVGKGLFSDSAALDGLRLMGQSLITAQRDGSDSGARSEVMLAAFLGGIALGSGGTSAAHALQYPIGAATRTPHGFGVGALLPYVIRYNLPVRVPEFAQIAVALGVAGGADPWTDAVAAIHALDQLVDGLGVPTLTELGVTSDLLEQIAEQGLLARRLVDNNPRVLDFSAMQEIMRSAFLCDRSLPEQESAQ
jgi:alcohol dehydrogenase class IV